MEKEMISEMERVSLKRQFNEQEGLATRVTQHIMLKEGEEGVELWKKHSIYKVHAAMAAVNPEAYTPKMVSMGPYHHGKEHLMPMEVHKLRAARRFIEDSGKSIKDFIDGLWEVLPELMDSYCQLDRVWREDKNNGRFLELMLIDGCFLLEILCNACAAENDRHYDENDPVFSVAGVQSHLAQDMMMLENQNSTYIKDLMLVVLYGRKNTDHVREGKHMLDVTRRNLFKSKEGVQRDGVSMFLEAIATQPGGFVGANKETLEHLRDILAAKKSRSVMELRRAGVKFKKAEDKTIPLSSIRFENNGVITIPAIPLDTVSENHFCNMVAFELIHPGPSFPTLFYFTFMKGLLTSAADVRHLRSLEIIQSTESSDDAIVETFQRFAKYGDNLPPDANLYQVQDELNTFYQKRMTGCRGRIWEWITSLKENYFKNPWTLIAVVSATLLLALTMAQTYYTALPYWDSNHKNN